MTKEKYYWLNEDSIKFLERGYLGEGETPMERIQTIALTAQNILGIDGFADKFMEYMSKGFYSLSTPVWMNFGNKRGNPISCFNSHIGDSVEDFLIKQAEVGMMTKVGGGTSGYFGDIRSRGSAISTGGIAEGAVRCMELFDNVASIISQGSARRGSFAAYLPIDHGDFDEFMKIRSEGHSIQEMSIGVTIPDGWMQSMIDGDKEKRRRWAAVIKKRSETGYPYVFFTDNANNQKPQVYKDKGYQLNASNLCVTGNQRVVSNLGMLTAKELCELGVELQLFDNKKIVNSSPMKLVERDADVYRVTLENGMSHEITAYHKLVTSSRPSGHDEAEEIKECKDLKIGDRIAVQTNKGIFGNKSMLQEAFLLGLYQSDGTQHKQDIMLDVWENDFDLLDEIQQSFNDIHHRYNCDQYMTTNQHGQTFTRSCKPAVFHECQIKTGGNVRKKRLSSRTLKKALNFEKGYIPDWIWESNEATQWQYVRGLLIADGTVNVGSSNGNPLQLSYADINKDFLKELQILFANLGIQTSIRILRKAGKSLLPDGKGGQKYYDTKDCWRLIVSNKNDAITIEKNTGFLTRKGVSLEDRDYRDNTKKYFKIESIEYIGKEDVYCCTVDSDEHLWICNGFITHNCSEIFLPSAKYESFVCCLSSINLLWWDEIKMTDAVETLVMFLDAVMTEFIEKTKDDRLMEAAHRFAKNHRALGMGVLGYHSYLQSKMIAWESMDAHFENIDIFSTIRERADKATEFLASKFGEPEVLKGYGRRNTTTLAIAPTTSSSFILGQVSPSIEPLNSNYFVKNLAKGNFSYRNPKLIEILEQKGKNTQEVWKDILVHGGSVQHLEFLSQEEKNVFKTFGELSQKEVVVHAAQRQPFIDQGQSLNVMIPANTKPKEINELMIFAWQNGIKSLYYQRSSNPSQDLARSILTCASCES